jgi:hypothetical protein
MGHAVKVSLSSRFLSGVHPQTAYFGLGRGRNISLPDGHDLTFNATDFTPFCGDGTAEFGELIFLSTVTGGKPMW